MTQWKLSADGLSASRELHTGECESRFISAIDPAELANALPADPVDLALDVRSKRDVLIEGTRWMVERHRDQIDAGTATTLTVAQFANVLIYRQALRDISKQAGFPSIIDWPVL